MREDGFSGVKLMGQSQQFLLKDLGLLDSKPEATKEGSLPTTLWMVCIQKIPGDLLQRDNGIGSVRELHQAAVKQVP